jgi:hypothetical protein
MTPLSAKDRNILGLYAARMSTASIAFMCGSSEAAIYNRLGRLQVTSVAQALDMLRADDGARKACADRYAPKTPKPKVEAPPAAPLRLAGLGQLAGQPFRRFLAQQLAKAKPVSAVPARPSPARTASPTVAAPPHRRGGLRLKPVTDRIARWAGHFLRARWSLQEVADLFGVAEDDLAQACEARP